jgi:preprotein translocase subunit SecA
MGFLNKLFPSENDRNVKKLKKIADGVQALEERFKELSDDELKETTAALKRRLDDGETLDDVLPEAFAAVREASGRVLGMRHFYVQLLGGIALHQGRIIEMKTGEGKTLVATLPTYLNALAGKGVHVVTVNDYLARRDAEWMGKIFRFLGLTVGVVTPRTSHAAKKAAYECDITYATNNELGFDYLRDNMAVYKEARVQRELSFAIVDEVDSILIDEARTPLIISGRGEKSSDLYSQANLFAKRLTRGDPDDPDGEADVIIEDKEKTVRLSESGIVKAERFFKLENLADLENSELNHHINNALKAQFMMKKDSDYIVENGEIIIVDEFTGRQMIGRRFSEGLHQAIEAKENVPIKNENKTMATITFQNYFRLYRKLSGMTGTAKTEEVEFKGIYKLDVVVLPTNIPMIRNDENDKLYTTAGGKLRAIAADVEDCYKRGQPVLVGTVSVEKSEQLSRLLLGKRIPHKVLNAKRHQEEAEIVAQAGRLKQVTIATNMAGRGTDITLGGNPEYLAKQELKRRGADDEIISAATASFEKPEDAAKKIAARVLVEELERKRHEKDTVRSEVIKAVLLNLPSNSAEIIKEKEKFQETIDDIVKKIAAAKIDYEKLYERFKQEIKAEKEEVKKLGGLRIVGTERHDSRRIDNQLRGRSGRQGDPGSSVFYLSLDDDITKVLDKARFSSIISSINTDEDIPITNVMVTRLMERAQKIIEDMHYSSRKRVLAYDDVMNKQREIIYGERNKVLTGEDVHDQILSMVPDVAASIIRAYADFEKDLKTWDYKAFNSELERILLPEGTNIVTPELAEKYSFDDISDAVVKKATECYENKIAAFASKGVNFGEVERETLLRFVDAKWTDHIDAMDALRKGIGLRAYGQTDPVIAYTKEGFEMFGEATHAIRFETVHHLMKVERIRVGRQAVTGEAGFASDGSGARKRQPIKKEKEPGPNDPCPCGSGKKYKHCCGGK